MALLVTALSRMVSQWRILGCFLRVTSHDHRTDDFNHLVIYANVGSKSV